MKIYLDNAYYFFTCATSQHKPFLENDLYKRIVFDKISEALKNLDLPNLAASVQNNHYHFLTKIDKKDKIGEMMNKINGGSSYQINKIENINRRFWGDYWMRVIDDELVLNKVTGYIVGNPLKHKIVKDFEELRSYPYCTFDKLIAFYDKQTAEEFVRSVIKLDFE